MVGAKLAVPGVVKRIPPGPRGHWLLGVMRRFQLDPIPMYVEAWKEYGDLVRCRILPGMYVYLVVHPEGVEHVLQHNHRNYRKPDFFNSSVRHLVGNGILNTEGETWLRQRRLMQPAFHRQQLTSIGVGMNRNVDSFIDEWSAAPSPQVLDIVAAMMRLTLRIVSTALFSQDVSGAADSFGRALRNNFEYVSLKMNSRLLPPRWFPAAINRRFEESERVLTKVVRDVIDSRRSEGRQERDLLALLLAAKDSETGAVMTDQELQDAVLTLLVAGHDTVGAALSWAWYLLSQHPSVQEDLAAEVRGKMKGATPSIADLADLPLARAVFEESMRLYPPAWGQPRETIGEDEIQGYAIPKKTIVTVNQYLTHRHPDFWEAPEEFRPQRFLGEHPERPKFAYFPFGGGPRICIGHNFAMMEGPLVLAALAQRFRFELLPGQKVEMDPTFTLRPKYPLQMKVTAR